LLIGPLAGLPLPLSISSLSLSAGGDAGRSREEKYIRRPVSSVERERESKREIKELLQVLNTDMSDLMLLIPWYSYINLLLLAPPASSF